MYISVYRLLQYNKAILEMVLVFYRTPQEDIMEEKPRISKAQQKAVHKYVKNNYDRLELTVPKGKKDEIKAHAEQHGESVNGFIGRAIDEAMERDKGGG